MPKTAPTLEQINRQLTRAARVLDATATDLRDAKFNSGQNIYRIGSALSSIFEIQHEIYRARPNLLPKHLYESDLGREVLSNSRSNGRAAKPVPMKKAKRAPRSPKR